MNDDILGYYDLTVVLAKAADRYGLAAVTSAFLVTAQQRLDAYGYSDDADWLGVQLVALTRRVPIGFICDRGCSVSGCRGVTL